LTGIVAYKAAPILKERGPSTAPAAASAARRVAPRLLNYLRERLQSRVTYAHAPTVISDGWETYIFRFQLKSEGLPVNWQKPLILRVHTGPHGVPRVQHEAAVHAHLFKLQYPVPRVLLHETNHELLGGPFLLMPEIQGSMMLQAMLHAPWQIFTSPAQMAETHLRLHELPTEQFPKSAEPMLDTRLQGLSNLVGKFYLDGLRHGLDWLKANRPSPPDVLSILHLDYHPMNLIRCGMRNAECGTKNLHSELVVLDWTYAEVGDSHADIATTMMLMECVPVHGQSLRNQITTAIGRPFLRSAYLREYNCRRKIDPDRLAYYQAWASLRRLAIYGRWLRIGPAQTGCRPDVLRRLDHIPVLERYFQKWSGVRVHLGRAKAV
jgi:aminoglycoside phosphotransferase (APT) family kinase protein